MTPVYKWITMWIFRDFSAIMTKVSFLRYKFDEKNVDKSKTLCLTQSLTKTM